MTLRHSSATPEFDYVNRMRGPICLKIRRAGVGTVSSLFGHEGYSVKLTHIRLYMSVVYFYGGTAWPAYSVSDVSQKLGFWVPDISVPVSLVVYVRAKHIEYEKTTHDFKHETKESWGSTITSLTNISKINPPSEIKWINKYIALD